MANSTKAVADGRAMGASQDRHSQLSQDGASWPLGGLWSTRRVRREGDQGGASVAPHKDQHSAEKRYVELARKQNEVGVSW